jgi:hypothetical protein
MKEIINFTLRCISFILRRVLSHTVKSYDMGPTALLPHPKEGVLRIFIALKNPTPSDGMNPRTLGPMASMLTTEDDTFVLYSPTWTYGSRWNNSYRAISTFLFRPEVCAKTGQYYRVFLPKRNPKYYTSTLSRTKQRNQLATLNSCNRILLLQLMHCLKSVRT